MNIEVKDKLYKKIEEFCQLNSIDDITSFINKLIEKQFTIHVYGDKPGIYRRLTLDDVEEVLEEKPNVISENSNGLYKIDTGDGVAFVDEKIMGEIEHEILNTLNEESDNVQNTKHEVVDSVQNVEHYDNGVELVTMENVPKRKRRVLK